MHTASRSRRGVVTVSFQKLKHKVKSTYIMSYCSEMPTRLEIVQKIQLTSLQNRTPVFINILIPIVTATCGNILNLVCLQVTTLFWDRIMVRSER